MPSMPQLPTVLQHKPGVAQSCHTHIAAAAGPEECAEPGRVLRGAGAAADEGPQVACAGAAGRHAEGQAQLGDCRSALRCWKPGKGCAMPWPRRPLALKMLDCVWPTLAGRDCNARRGAVRGLGLVSWLFAAGCVVQHGCAGMHASAALPVATCCVGRARCIWQTPGPAEQPLLHEWSFLPQAGGNAQTDEPRHAGRAGSKEVMVERCKRTGGVSLRLLGTAAGSRSPAVHPAWELGGWRTVPAGHPGSHSSSSVGRLTALSVGLSEQKH